MLAFTKGHPSDTLTIQQRLSKIPQEDQKVLHDFFHDMLSQGDFAAVLLADKPSSIHDRVWWFAQLKDRRIKDFIFLTYRGNQTWQKYAHLFPSKSLVLMQEKYHEGIFFQWFAKKAFEQKIKKLDQYSKSNLEIHQKLGQLLGYPKRDIDGFCEEKRIRFTLSFFPYETDEISQTFELGVDALLNDPHEDPITRLEKLQKAFKFRYTSTEVEPFFPTKIHGHSSFEETPQERSAWKQKVADLYNSENFLEDVLTLITE